MTRIATSVRPVNNLADLAEMLRWVAWRTETRKGEPTKIPYDPRTGRQAKIPTDPTTWNTRAKAEWRWGRLNDGERPGGVGIVLGDLGNGYHLMGLDLDSCATSDGDGGYNIEPFANSILERFNSYAEVSPSRQGIKAFFLIKTEHKGAVDRLLESKTRKAFTAGEHKEIAVDLARYYAVTDEFLADHQRLRVVEVEDIRWFVQEAGPQFHRQHNPPTETAAPTGEARPGRDNTGSGYGFRFLARLKGAGASFEEAGIAILADENEAGEWARRVDEDQLRRAWDNARILNRGAPLECAREFIKVCGQMALVHHRSDFYRWLGPHYERCDDEQLRKKMYEFLDHSFALGAKGNIVPFNPTAHHVNQIIDALKAAAGGNSRQDIPFWLDNDSSHPEPSNLMACHNGLLNLQTRELLPHSAQFFNTYSLPFDYDPEAEAYPPQWMEFLRQLWPGNKGKAERQCLQEMFGLALTTITEQQKMFLLLGPRRSGKGTIARVLTGMLGPDSVVSPTLASLSSEFGQSPLIGKRIALISDARLGDRTNVQAVVERLLTISGEDALSINRKYKSHWNGRLNVRVWMLSNELPRVTDSSGAFTSRFILLVLKNSFYGREDTGLTRRLLTELPGILNWSLIGLTRLLERGHFEMPESSLQAIRQFEDLASPVGAFVRDWCTVDPSKRVRVKHLYKVWKLWCEQQGQPPGSNAVFGRNLRAAVSQLRVSGRGGNRTYLGLTLNANAEEV